MGACLISDPHPPSHMAQALDYAEDLKDLRPSAWYVSGCPVRYPDPLDRYQLQFHKSPHIVRMLVLGNGAGKTTTGGVEADWWLQGTHPYQVTPKRGVQALWVCQKYKQFEEMQPQFERRCFTRGFSFNKSDYRYTWPNGSTLTVFSDEGSWAGAQGMNPDIVFIDEECDVTLWRELTMRRRGDRQTRFCIMATATKGKRWMYHELYAPWEKHYQALGLSEAEAMRQQPHPQYFVWPRGGLMDNPTSTPEERQWYEATLAHASAQERAVRLGGGFIDLNKSPVFDLDALDDLEQSRKAEAIGGESGILIDDAGNTRPTFMQLGGPDFYKTADLPIHRRRFTFEPTGGEWEGGRLEVYEDPDPTSYYVMGADFAQGLATGDFDTAFVGRVREDGKLVQVAEAQGRWGQTTAPVLFMMLGWYYNEALLVGEANSMGLGNLRLMWEAGYVYQYIREAKPDGKSPGKTDRLGYWKGNSLPIESLKRVIAPRKAPAPQRLPADVVIRSPRLIEELRRFELRPRNTTAEITDVHDNALVMGAERGYHDDLVSSLAMAVIGWRELPHFERPDRVFKHGSAGAVLDHAAVLAAEKPQRKAFSFAR